MTLLDAVRAYLLALDQYRICAPVDNDLKEIAGRNLADNELALRQAATEEQQRGR